MYIIVFGMDNVAMRQKGKKGNKSSLIKEPILFGASFLKFMSCSVNNVIFSTLQDRDLFKWKLKGLKKSLPVAPMALLEKTSEQKIYM